MLIRRDNVEHLIMIGGPNDVVVETNIVRGAGAPRMPAQAVEAMPERQPLPSDDAGPSRALDRGWRR